MNRIRTLGLVLTAVSVAVLVALPSVAYALPTHFDPIWLAPFLVGATNANYMPTLLDLAKAQDPDGSEAQIVEILNETNEILEDAIYIPGNLLTGHRTTVRTGIPAPTWRKLYGAVSPTKGTTAQVTDNCGMLEAYARVDKKLVDLHGAQGKAFRFDEDRTHIEGMSQELAATLIYGNEGTEPEAFTGFAPRFANLTDESKDNIVDHGGSGSDNTSIWLVGWGRQTCHGIVPQHSTAGIKSNDLGEQMIQESGGAAWQALVTHYTLDAGLSVRDWRFIARVCNIDVSDLATATNCDELIASMIKAAERIPTFSGSGTRFAWYCNRTVRQSLRIGILEKVANNLSWETVAGKRVMVFDDIPVRRVDAILNTEARIIA